MPPLRERHCRPLPAGSPALDAEAARHLLGEVPGWAIGDTDRTLVRSFAFDDFHRTMGFVNAVAFVANQQDHHPDMEVHYGRCVITFSTHSVGGLSENDFICAARINALLDQ